MLRSNPDADHDVWIEQSRARMITIPSMTSHMMPLQPTAQTAAPLEALAGTVERVTYHNTENGFAVLRVQTRGKRDLVTVVGHAASVM